ncbi:uncharacterized protein V1510DRAFT_419440 [Dipodascopsis tothii]|uniref:uncharacterized protein n=1 Tax=Dipodascopsis tothii TaxID=44089 RepID=UPI0034CE329F
MAHKLEQSDLVAFQNQAAGHDGVLQSASGHLIIKPSTEAEVEFYESLADDAHADFAALTPTYMGRLDLKLDDPVAAAKTPVAVVLENATHNFRKPAVLDVKLGKLLTDPATTSADKIARLGAVAATTTTGSLGFRIAGMRVWRGTEYEYFDKTFGRGFTAETVADGFRAFFPAALGPARTARLVEMFAGGLAHVQQVLEASEVRMYSASVLFVYEGDVGRFDEIEAAAEAGAAAEPDPPSDSDDEPGEPELCTLKLIDFAHSHWVPGEGPDTNVLGGLASLAAIFDRL